MRRPPPVAALTAALLGAAVALLDFSRMGTIILHRRWLPRFRVGRLE